MSRSIRQRLAAVATILTLAGITAWSAYGLGAGKWVVGAIPVAMLGGTLVVLAGPRA